MNKRPFVFMALIVLSGIACGIHEINIMVRAVIALFMLLLVLFSERGFAGRSLFFCLKRTVLYLLLFCIGLIRADFESSKLDTDAVRSFYKSYEISNPGEFDYVLYLKSKGITSEEQLEQSRKVRAPGLDYLREYMSEKLSKNLRAEDAGIMRAMLLGDKTELEPWLRELYRRAGISHIISISGLHVSLAGMTFFTLLKRMKLGLNRSLAGAAVMTIGYGMLTGNAVSTIRAVIMLLVRYLGMYLGRGYDMLTAVFLSAVIIVVMRPYMLMQAGFQLSFAAVIAISYVSPVLTRAIGCILNSKAKWISVISVSIAIHLVSFPVLLYHYFEINIYSMLLNLIIVPMAGLAIYSGAVVILSGAAADLADVLSVDVSRLAVLSGAPAYYILKLFKMLAAFSAELPFSRLCMGRPEPTQLLLYFSVIFIALELLRAGTAYTRSGAMAYRSMLRRSAFSGVIVLMLAFGGVLKRAEVRELKIVNMDVGQGDCCLILNRGRAVMLDGGSSSVRNIYDRRIKNTLGFYGVDKLDAVIVSHADADHINGIVEMLESGWIGTDMLILPGPAKVHEKYDRIQAAYERNTKRKPEYLYEGNTIRIGDRLSIKCIQGGIEDVSDVNRHSPMLLISYGAFKMLSTGDAVAEDEDSLCTRLRNNYGNIIGEEGLDFYKAAHHGSGGSNSRALISLIRPDYIFYSCGRNNRYGHPDRGLVEFAEQSGIRGLVSYETGAVIIDTDGEATRIFVMKSQK